ncbi:MAG: PHP domain-containing protein [Leptolyngbya sp.]|nr:PHP domain-containing protein [Candidatus Melainabacteria bacterium]
MSDNLDIANYLRETGLLLSAKGDNPFKARAYIKGAQAIESLQMDIGGLIKEDRLTDVPGIGKSLANTIKEIYSSGSSKLLHNLKEELPEGVIELSNLPGMSLQRIKLLDSELGIKSLEELEKACKTQVVRTVKGFTARTERALLGAIERYKNRSTSMLLVDALELADEIQLFLKPASKDSEVLVTGELRKWYETIESIQFVVSAKDSKKITARLKKYPLVQKVEDESSDRIKVLLSSGVTVEIFFAENPTLKLMETTGKEHFQHLQKLAKAKHFKLTSNTFTRKHPIIVVTESQVYDALGIALVPPEMREDAGEIEQAKEDDFSNLIDIGDIKGMTHCHSTFSDGRHSIEQMARAADKLGMKYITMTDHSPTAHYAGGLTIDRLKQQWEEIDEVQEKVNVRILKGTECDILADGQLDYPDEILEKFDVIIASIHNRYRQNEEQMTKRLLRGLKNPLFKIWGHPLGRLVLRRDPIPCDIEKIFDAVQDANIAIEISGDPYRLDLQPLWIKAARKRGFKFVISTDEHTMSDMLNLTFGIHMARRAGVTKTEVLNAQTYSFFKKTVKPAS